MYYIGLTDDSLILIEQDSFGDHADINRIPVADIKSTKFKKKFPFDQWQMDLGDNKRLDLFVNSGLRHLSSEIYEKLKELIDG
jgi:hypothetical protein